jgi:hypothetical protein
MKEENPLQEMTSLKERGDVHNQNHFFMEPEGDEIQ